MSQDNFRFNYTNITANSTNVISAVPCLLHTITVNVKGGSSNTVTIYDNNAASGTKIATIDSTANGEVLIYDVWCKTGLTVVVATGTAGDITVTWG